MRDKQRQSAGRRQVRKAATDALLLGVEGTSLSKWSSGAFQRVTAPRVTEAEPNVLNLEVGDAAPRWPLSPQGPLMARTELPPPEPPLAPPPPRKRKVDLEGLVVELDQRDNSISGFTNNKNAASSARSEDDCQDPPDTALMHYAQ